jgi:hypothetical protein
VVVSPVTLVTALPPPDPVAGLTLPVVLVTAVPPPQLNVTAEPPLAKPLPPLPVPRLPRSQLQFGPTVEPPTAPSPVPTAPLGLPPIPTSLPPPVKK